MPNETPTVVEKVNVDINLSKGIDESTAEESVVWQNQVTELENLDVNGDSLQLRPGLERKVAQGSFRGMTRIASMDGGLVGVVEGILKQLDETNVVMSDKGGVQNVYTPYFTPENWPVDAGSKYGICGVAAFPKYLVFATASGLSATTNGGFINIADIATKNIVKRYSVQDLAGICRAGNYLHIYTHPSTGNPSFASVDMTVSSENLPTSISPTGFAIGIWPSGAQIAAIDGNEASDASFAVSYGFPTYWVYSPNTGSVVSGSSTTMFPDGSATDVNLSGSTGFLAGYYDDVSPPLFSTLRAWYRADLGVTQVAGVVSQWNDSSGAGDANRNLSQSTAASKPAFTASNANFNGKPTIDTDGVDDFLDSGTFSGGAYAQPITMYIVARSNSLATGPSLVDSPTVNREVPFIGGGGEVNMFAGAVITSAAGAWTNATTHVTCFVWNGASSAAYVDRYNTATVTGNPGAASFDAIRVGYTAAGSRQFNGSYGEIIVYSGAHNATTRQSIMQGLGTRYGVTVTA
jgi:hypothetical protein